MKRPKLVRDDSGERDGWWLGDRFVPDKPPEVDAWYRARELERELAAASAYAKHVQLERDEAEMALRMLMYRRRKGIETTEAQWAALDRIATRNASPLRQGADSPCGQTFSPGDPLNAHQPDKAGKTAARGDAPGLTPIAQSAPATHDDALTISCPEAEKMGEFACKDKSQCWEPCGELGNDPAHVRVASPQDERAVDAALGYPALLRRLESIVGGMRAGNRHRAADAIEHAIEIIESVGKPAVAERTVQQHGEKT